MRPLLLLLLAAGAAAPNDNLAHRIAVNAGHPEARVVTLEQERKLAAQPLNETIVWCDMVVGQLACSVEVGAHGEWTSQEFLPNLNGIEGKAIGVAWWLPEARTLKPWGVASGTVPPLLISGTEAKYTPEARKARIGGIVIVEVIIDKSGRVVAARILKALPFGLSEAAVEAVKKWRFKPATREGEPVAVRYNLTVNFRLD
ncbi:MAG TPA: energy transducer TonB [Vicinamibacterales bacterium]